MQAAKVFQVGCSNSEREKDGSNFRNRDQNNDLGQAAVAGVCPSDIPVGSIENII